MILMRRFLAGALLASLLALLGLQSAHAHAGPVPETCAVCAVAGHVQAIVPAAAPALPAPAESGTLPDFRVALALVGFAAVSLARGPPPRS